MDRKTSDILLGIIPGPVWTERCGHGGYIASYECPDGKGGEKIDLYVWHNEHEERQRLCLRYGEQDSEYYSPVSVVNMLKSTNFLPYSMACDILLSIGKIEWSLKTN